MTATIATINVTTATGKELLAFFNEHTGGNQLVKFQNRAQGEARVLALIAEMEAEESGDDTAANAACQRGSEVVLSTDDAVALGKKLAVTEPADRIAVVDKVIKPYQGAKAIVADCIARGITARKDIIAAGLAAGIKYNTIDGAHYTMCIKKG